MLYKEKLTEWFKIQKIYLKYSTYTNYYNIIMNHIYPKPGNYDISMIDNNILQQFILEQLKNGRADNKGGISHKYVKDIITLLKLTLDNRDIKIQLPYHQPKDIKMG